MAEFFADGFDELSELIRDGLEDEVVGGGVAELGDAEAALEAGDAVEAVVGFVFLDDAPEVVTLDSPLTGITHGF